MKGFPGRPGKAFTLVKGFPDRSGKAFTLVKGFPDYPGKAFTRVKRVEGLPTAFTRVKSVRMKRDSRVQPAQFFR